MIDPTKDTYVERRMPQTYGGSYTYQYHAKACWSAYEAWVKIHEYQPLDPAGHEHE